MLLDLLIIAFIWGVTAASSLWLPWLSQPHPMQGIRLASDVLIRGSPAAWVVVISRHADWTLMGFTTVLGLWLACYAGVLCAMRKTHTIPEAAALRRSYVVTANLLAFAAIALPILLTPR